VGRCYVNNKMAANKRYRNSDARTYESSNESIDDYSFFDHFCYF
jgi:hypothetical protein